MDCKIITVFSNKGGVGKTFVSVNLATVLASSGKNVLLIDFDSRAAQDMARMLNLFPKKTFIDIVPDLESENFNIEFVTKDIAKHVSGFDFIPSVRDASQIGGVTSENVKRFLKNIRKKYEYIVVDAGSIFNEILITIFDYSNLILLVATPDVLAVYQIKGCLDILQKLQMPLRMVKLVLNRSESKGSVAWQEIRSVLPCEIFSHIPSDGNAVGRALNRGIPCVLDSPKNKVTDSFNKMASALQNNDICVAAMESDKAASAGFSDSFSSEFWEKFGKSQEIESKEGLQSYFKEEDERLLLKKRVHEKLIDRLNMEGIKTESLGDPRSLADIKKKSEKVVLDLLVEESGGRIASYDERRLLVKDIVDEALGLGALEELLADKDVTDIMVNGTNGIYIEKKGKLIFTNKSFISDSKIRTVIDRIVAPLGRRIDESTPMVDARLPDGSRVNAIIPPLSLCGPMVTIRKFAKDRLEIENLLNEYHSLNKNMADFLRACVLGKRNMIISGGTGAGKTTLLNVVSHFIPDDERIISIEDAAELKLRQVHWGRLESRPMNVEGKGEITIRDLFVNSLRMRPDRIIIGECRGSEVLDMLQAMNTGHEGSMTTLHANSTRDAVTRLNSMILLSGIDLHLTAINEMIASAIHIIVHVSRLSDGSRKITGISETDGLESNAHVKLNEILRFDQEGVDKNGKVIGSYSSTGIVPQCYKLFETRGIAIDKNIFKND